MKLDDIDKEISSLQSQYTSIEESSISEGIKTEILSVVAQAKENLENIRPIYENIDQINSFIVDPTKQEIETAFSDFKTQNNILAKRNNAFSKVSLFIGIAGLVLTVFSFINPFNSPFSKIFASGDRAETNVLESTSDLPYSIEVETNIVGNVQEVLENYAWMSDINPNYESSLLSSERLNIGFDDGFVTIKLEHPSNTVDELQSIQIEEIRSAMVNFIASLDVNFSEEDFQLYSYTFTPNEYTPRTELRFVTKNIPRIVDSIYWVKERNAFLMLSFTDGVPFTTELFTEKNDPILGRYSDRTAVINTFLDLIYLLSDSKFKLEKNLYFMNIPQEVNTISEEVKPLLVFSPFD